MQHHEWFEAISAAADGQLDAAEQAALDAHLAGCSGCTDLLRSFERERRRLRFQSTAPRGDLVTTVLAARTAEVTDRRRGRVVLGRRLAFASSLAAAAVVGVAALPGPADAPGPATSSLASTSVQIHARDHSFTTPDIEVDAGTTVQWHNEGGTTHNLVRKLGGATVSEDLTPGQTESATFAEPGTYEYYCTIHPEMTGTVTVDA